MKPAVSPNGAPGFAKGERSAPFGRSGAKPQTPQICEVRCANEHIKGRSPGAPIFGNERSEFPNIVPRIYDVATEGSNVPKGNAVNP